MPSILRLLILVNSLQNRFKENGAKIPVPKGKSKKKGWDEIKKLCGGETGIVPTIHPGSAW